MKQEKTSARSTHPFMCRRYNNLLGEIHVPSDRTHIYPNDPLITNKATLWARPGLWDYLPFRTILSYVKRNRSHLLHTPTAGRADILPASACVAIALLLTIRARLRLLFHFLAARGFGDTLRHSHRLLLRPSQYQAVLSLQALFLRPSRLRVHPATRLRTALHQFQELYFV